jgi:long-chain acyl-CoA synthetase
MIIREHYDDFPVLDTIKELVASGGERGGDKRQFIWEEKDGTVQERTFRQVNDDVNKIGKFYRKHNIVKGTKASVLGENSYAWHVFYYALAFNGSVILPSDPRLPAEELAGQFAETGCEAVFYSESNADKIEIIKNTPGVVVREYHPIEDLEKLLKEGEEADEKYLKEFMDEEVVPDDLACICYTSGTTGKTKGVMLTHKNIMTDLNASLHAITGENAIGFLPLNHTYAWSTGLFASLLRVEWGYISTNLRHVYDDIKKYKPYQFAAVPLVIEMIYNSIISKAKRNGTYDKLMQGIELSNNMLLSGVDLRREIFSEIHEAMGGNLHYIISSGAYLNPEIEKFMHDIGIPIFTGYGLTECSPCVSITRMYNYRMGSVGLPIECCTVKINEPDEDGIGEIYVKGPNVMIGYYNDPESTAEAFDGEWLKTGDYGYIDKDGYIFFTGRKKNLIILSNGKNVSPEEIEVQLQNIEYVKEVICYGENGRIVGEFFLDEEQFPDARERLKNDVLEVNKKLADYKQVARIVVRDEEFPKTTSLKIIRSKNQK